MKTKRVTAVCLAVMLVATLSLARPAKSTHASQAFMRKKLEYSQKVYEGMVLERYGDVAKNAMQLYRVIDTNSFFFSKDVYYLESTGQFRADTAELYQAALATNGPAVLAAYGKVTTDCVSCHQQFHRAKIGRNTNDSNSSKPTFQRALVIRSNRRNP